MNHAEQTGRGWGRRQTKRLRCGLTAGLFSIWMIGAAASSAALPVSAKEPVSGTAVWHLGSDAVTWIAPHTTVGTLIVGLRQALGDTRVQKEDGSVRGVREFAATGDRLVSSDGSQPERRLSVAGDVTGDGEVTADDKAHIKQSLVGALSLEGVYKQAGDADQSGAVTVGDVIYLEQYLRNQQPLGGGASPLEIDTRAPVPMSDSVAKFLGRTYEKNGYRFFNWSASGFEVCFEGSSLGANVTAKSTSDNNWKVYLNVYVDGSEEPRVVPVGGPGLVTLADGLGDGRHTVRVLNRNEEQNVYFGVKSLVFPSDAAVYPPPADKGRLIEVIGDSITTGHGALVTNGQGAFSNLVSDGAQSYGVIAANRLDADFSLFANSSHGVRYCYGNDSLRIPPVYAYTDSRNNPGALWDFAARPADVVVVNLGTNDDNTRLAGGAYDSQGFTDAYVDFLKDIRSRNPDAVILCVMNLMRTVSLTTNIQTAVQMRNNAGDAKVYFYSMNTKTAAEGSGTSGHPSLATHKRAGAELAEVIRGYTGW